VGKKRKMEIKHVCEKCGKVPEKDESKSNENWTVIPVICPDCGGHIKMTFEEDEKEL